MCTPKKSASLSREKADTVGEYQNALNVDLPLDLVENTKRCTHFTEHREHGGGLKGFNPHLVPPVIAATTTESQVTETTQLFSGRALRKTTT